MRVAINFYDRVGESIDQWQWVELFENFDYQRVENTEVGPYRVATNWMGFDLSIWGDGPPLIFETMVFATGTPYDLDCRRYATEDEARAGHDELVLLLRATVQDADDVLPDEAPISQEQEGP